MKRSINTTLLVVACSVASAALAAQDPYSAAPAVLLFLALALPPLAYKTLVVEGRDPRQVLVVLRREHELDEHLVVARQVGVLALRRHRVLQVASQRPEDLADVLAAVLAARFRAAGVPTYFLGEWEFEAWTL